VDLELDLGYTRVLMEVEEFYSLLNLSTTLSKYECGFTFGAAAMVRDIQGEGDTQSVFG
jgi:hypothetical protein